MIFPNTPCLPDPKASQHSWEVSWEEFFDIYHETVRICVRGAFQRQNWHNVQESDIQDVVSRVFESIHHSLTKTNTFEVDPRKGRFRQFLTTIINCRVIDFIRKQNTFSNQAVPTEVINMPLQQSVDAFREEETRAFQRAFIGSLLAALQTKVSPRVYRFFDLVVLHGDSPEQVAREFNVSRSVVDNSVYKARQKLKEIYQQPDVLAEAI